VPVAILAMVLGGMVILTLGMFRLAIHGDSRAGTR
jgi:hypothetical protein